MKKILFSVAVLFSFIGLSCSKKVQIENDTITIITVSKEVFKDKMKETADFQLVDVRTPEEYKAGSIESSVNIDYKAADFMKKLSELDTSKPTFIYCRSGNRSGKSLAIFHELGFKEVLDLEGGYMNW